MPLKYVKLMRLITSKEVKGKEAGCEQKLNEFVDECKSFGVTRINEWKLIDKSQAEIKNMIYKQ